MGAQAGQGWRSEREDAPFHKPHCCWTTGRVMGESPLLRRVLPGALPPSAGAGIISGA